MAMDPDVTESSPSEAPARAGRLEDLYVRNAPSALRLAYFLTGSRELAEDLAQEAFVRVAGRLRHLRVPDAFDAYLRRTIVNLYTSQLRRTKLERAYVARHGVEPAIAHEPTDPAARDSGATWSLTASRTGDLCWDIQVETDGRGTGTGACLTGKSGDAPSLVPVHVAPSTTVIAGTIPEDAVVVEIDILDPQTAQTGIYQNPPMFPAPSDAWGDVRFMVFAVPGTIPMGSVRVRFQDIQGNDLYARQVIEW